MIIWGAIWGAILGLFSGNHASEGGAILGALLGALAGHTLRGALRKEIESQRVKWAASQSSTPARASPRTQEPTEEILPENNTLRDDLPVPPAPAQEALAPTVMMAATSTAAALPPVTPELAPPEAAAAAPTPDIATRAFQQARDWLMGGNTIVRMGALVLFVGLAFLAKFAIDHALLPPELRLAGIGLAGIALFALGFRLRRQGAPKQAYALTLQGAGVAVLYLTVFAAFRLYQFLPAGAAFALLALICAFATTIALLQNAMAMAFIGFAGAFAAPKPSTGALIERWLPLGTEQRTVILWLVLVGGVGILAAVAYLLLRQVSTPPADAP